MKLTDTHCHLNLDTYEKDLSVILNHAEEVGVHKILVPGIDIETSVRAVELSQQHDCLYAAVGIHPNSANTWDGKSKKLLYDLSQQPKVVAIGEIGLDFYRQKASRDKQHRILNDQLELAKETDLPVVIHNRDAGDVIFSLLLEWCRGFDESLKIKNRPGVLHSLNNPHPLLPKLMEANFFFGIAGPVTFQNANSLKEAVKQLPKENILTETDSPFLAPHPKRGTRNEPANVRFVAEKIAALKNLDLQELITHTFQNSVALFRWSNDA